MTYIGLMKEFLRNLPINGL